VQSGREGGDTLGLARGRLKARLDEMPLERELLEAKIAVLEERDLHPVTRRRSRR
jgi:transposase